MIDFLSLKQRDCPVCGESATSGEPFLDRRLNKEKLNEFSFASRKTPENMCYSLVRCPVCDVVYANESPDQAQIGEAYHQAAYDSKEEARHAAEAYEKSLKPYIQTMDDRDGALDIGTGTGIFLQILKEKGFTNLTGIEPSKAAIDAADDDIKGAIREGLFTASEFDPSSFSLISCFMTLEHVAKPLALARDCFHLLKPHGRMTVVVHDWRAWNNRILGARAPIIDIEHLQLFSKTSISELFKQAGFTDVTCQSFRNNYTLDYWNRLFPTPGILKQSITWFLAKTRIGRLRLSMNVGNLMVIARK